MCFIKPACMGSTALIGSPPVSTMIPTDFYSTKDYCNSTHSLEYAPTFSLLPPFFDREAALLSKLMASVHLNSQLLMKLGEVIHQAFRISKVRNFS